MGRCLECEARERQKTEYGFCLEDGAGYYTLIAEVKTCCPVRVTLKSHCAAECVVDYNGTEYHIPYLQFMRSSWRDYMSF